MAENFLLTQRRKGAKKGEARFKKVKNAFLPFLFSPITLLRTSVPLCENFGSINEK